MYMQCNACYGALLRDEGVGRSGGMRNGEENGRSDDVTMLFLIPPPPPLPCSDSGL